MPADYTQWLQELTQISDVLEAALGRLPHPEELAHYCWLRLRDDQPFEAVLANAQVHQDAGPYAPVDGETHAENLKRVQELIGPLVLEFCQLHEGQEWHIVQLLNYVHVRIWPRKIAPASPQRILQNMRKHKKLYYECLSRPKSLYWIPPPEEGGCAGRPDPPPAPHPSSPQPVPSSAAAAGKA